MTEKKYIITEEQLDKAMLTQKCEPLPLAPDLDAIKHDEYEHGYTVRAIEESERFEAIKAEIRAKIADRQMLVGKYGETEGATYWSLKSKIETLEEVLSLLERERGLK
jgi:hypothetical protein